MNTGDTVIQFPYGHAITFPSKRDFFRREKQIYKESIPSLNRKIDRMSPYDRELYRAVANMRIEQFANSYSSDSDLESAYCVCDKTMFQTKEKLKEAILEYDIAGEKISIGDTDSNGVLKFTEKKYKSTGQLKGNIKLSLEIRL